VAARSLSVWDPPISVTVYEAGAGDPMVFLHGPAAVTADDPVVQALASSCRVIAPVHPGFTDLADLDELRDVHDLALYHDELLDALGLDSVAMVGHSFGGMVAAELAAHYPRRVSKLVLAAPWGLWDDDHPPADLFTAFPLEIQDVLWHDPSKAVFEMPEGDDPLIAMLLAVLPGLTTIGKYTWPIPDKGLRRRLRRIAAPTLVLWGEKDKLIPARYADDFVAGIRDARAEVIPDAGHMLPWEQTHEFARAVDTFL
jgi:pimeloyl-ACP methyl ester carboxylesterase